MNNGRTVELGTPSIMAAKHRLTVLDFHRMIKSGILDEEDCAELIEGSCSIGHPLAPSTQALWML
jgi:hypothetical protein